MLPTVQQTMLSILLHLSLIHLSKSIVSSKCKFTLKDSNNVASDYDLSQFYFTGKNGNYIHEVDDKTNTHFAYKFNICGSIPKPLFVSNTSIPSYCLGSDKGPCIDFKDYSNGTVICNKIYPDTSTQIVPSAVQIVSASNANKKPSCYWLGMELSDKYANTTKYPNYKVDLIDTDNSGAGIVFTIMNGQFCSSGGGHNMNRQLSISLMCPDSSQTEWDTDLANVISEPVTESPICVYKITFESPLACPQQCISKKTTNVYAICSTHGICAADPNAGYSHCICDNGFGGDLCEKIISGVTVLDVGNEDLMGVIIICIVLTAICCGVAVYLWYYWRKGIKIDKMLETNEYFLNIDDEVEEDDDTINAGIRQKKTTDTFHPVLTADIETAKFIQIQHEKQRKEINIMGNHVDDEHGNKNEKEKEVPVENEDENENENDESEEDHQKNIENYVSDPDEEVPVDDEIHYVD